MLTRRIYLVGQHTTLWQQVQAVSWTCLPWHHVCLVPFLRNIQLHCSGMPEVFSQEQQHPVSSLLQRQKLGSQQQSPRSLSPQFHLRKRQGNAVQSSWSMRRKREKPLRLLPKRKLLSGSGSCSMLRMTLSLSLMRMTQNRSVRSVVHCKHGIHSNRSAHIQLSTGLCSISPVTQCRFCAEIVIFIHSNTGKFAAVFLAFHLAAVPTLLRLL